MAAVGAEICACCPLEMRYSMLEVNACQGGGGFSESISQGECKCWFPKRPFANVDTAKGGCMKVDMPRGFAKVDLPRGFARVCEGQYARGVCRG